MNKDEIVVLCKQEKRDLVKSPLNYIGGKFKLLPQILPLIPKDIEVFYDMFGGGANVLVNIKAEKHHYLDINNYVCEILNGINQESIEEILYYINSVIEKYELSKTNREGFEQLRNDYNNGKVIIPPPNNWIVLYVLMCYSFNYQLRFNNNHKYNSSFGKDRSYFSKTLEKKLIEFHNNINYKDVIFECGSVFEFDYSKISKQDFLYFDPPYLISCGVYQDGKRGFDGWNESMEKKLYDICDYLDKNGIRFAMSNVLEDKGKSNELLKEWSKKYNVHYLNSTYNNCNYQRKDSKKTVEVLITNYE